MVHGKLLTKKKLTKKFVDKKNLLPRKICRQKNLSTKKKFVEKNIWPKFTTYVFPKNDRQPKFTTCVFPKIGRRPKFTKRVFPKIGLTRFPKSVHELSAREKLSVFVYASFFRGAYPVKFGYVQRRKYHVLTKCQNFSGGPVFLQNTFYV